MKHDKIIYINKATGNQSSSTPSTELSGDNKTSLISTGITAGADLVSTGLSTLGKGLGDAATGGLTAILSAVTGVISAVTGGIVQSIGLSQQAITQRRQIIAQELGDFMDMDTNKNSNLGFVIIAGLVLGGLIYIAAVKQKK